MGTCRPYKCLNNIYSYLKNVSEGSLDTNIEIGPHFNTLVINT